MKGVGGGVGMCRSKDPFFTCPVPKTPFFVRSCFIHTLPFRFNKEKINSQYMSYSVHVLCPVCELPVLLIIQSLIYLTVKSMWTNVIYKHASMCIRGLYPNPTLSTADQCTINPGGVPKFIIRSKPLQRR